MITVPMDIVRGFGWDNGWFYALNADGDILWTTDLHSTYGQYGDCTSPAGAETLTEREIVRLK